MASGITITISLAQIALFFAIMGGGVITVASFLVEDYSGQTGSSTGKKVIGSASVVLAAGVVQLVSSIAIYFKDNMKTNWIYISAALIITYIVCFTVLMVDGLHVDTFYLVVFCNWVLLFITIGLLSEDASPVAILFGMLGIGVVIFSSAVLNSYGSGYKKVVGCTAAVLVGGLIQTITSIILFFKANTKEIWMYCNAVVCILLIVCFSIVLADGQRGSAVIDRFYAITATDFVILFLVVGVFIKNRYMK